jgi:type IV pilus assembly protein PilA
LSETSKDLDTLMAIGERMVKISLPRALEIKERVDRGEVATDHDLWFLEEVLEDTHGQVKSFLHIDYAFFICHDHSTLSTDGTIMSARAKRRSQHGQGMTEYIVIVAMIAVAAIAVYQYFGQTVRNQTAAIAQELSGKDGTAAKTAAQTASDKAKTVGDQKHTLDTYVNQVGK